MLPKLALSLLVFVFKKEKGEGCLILVYARFLSRTAVATTIAMIITAAAMISRVSVGTPLSGCGAGVGEAVDRVGAGVVAIGLDVSVGVVVVGEVEVGLGVAGDAGASVTPIAISALDGQ